MGGGEEDECVVPRLETTSLPIPDELLAEILLRLPTPADLARASAGCVSFRRVAADRSFLRKYRKLHAPPLLGFLDRHNIFYPATPPYPSASAAIAVALAADFSFSFLPAPATDWRVQDIRDGRVLLDRPMRVQNTTSVLPELVVCDPLHRRYLLLPPITYELAASVIFINKQLPVQIFLVPPNCGMEADETSFRVVWMAECITELFAFVFSSNTGQWRAIPSQRWSNLCAGFPPSTATSLFYSRHYVYGCFYWVIDHGEVFKLLLLDTKTMEFSIAEPPPEAKHAHDFAMVEAGEGRPGIFVLTLGGSELSCFIGQNDGGQWQKVMTITIGCATFTTCKTEKHLFLRRRKISAVCMFMLDIETFQLEKVCNLRSTMSMLRAYSNFPPSLLSSPTISSGVREDAEKPMLEQDTEVLPAEAHSHHDQNTSDASAGVQSGASRIGGGAD